MKTSPNKEVSSKSNPKREKSTLKRVNQVTANDIIRLLDLQ